MTAIYENGEWKIPCVQYSVDEFGKPIPGSSVTTTMKASVAAEALISHVSSSVYGLQKKIEQQRAIARNSIELGKPSEIWRLPLC